MDGGPVGLTPRGPGLRPAVFAIEGWLSALPLAPARGLLPMVAVPPLPGVPAAALSPINLPGRVVPVPDIEQHLGLPPRDCELPSEGPGDRDPRGRGLPGGAPRPAGGGRSGPSPLAVRSPAGAAGVGGPRGPS
ncbi:MAG: chemotaxis protein CheW [Candidatus Methylomirabilales bacterium]